MRYAARLIMVALCRGTTLAESGVFGREAAGALFLILFPPATLQRIQSLCM
jgi:hypothetical protein